MDKAPDFKSEDFRFESCHAQTQNFLLSTAFYRTGARPLKFVAAIHGGYIARLLLVRKNVLSKPLLGAG